MKILFTLAIATVAGAITFGAAAALNVNAPNLGSGSDEVANCEGLGGVEVDYDLNSSNPTLVAGVTISNIDESCSGGVAYVALTDDFGATLPDGASSAIISLNATSVTVPYTPELAASDIGGLELTIVGPATAP